MTFIPYLIICDVEFSPSLPHATYAAGLVLVVLVHILSKCKCLLKMIIIIHWMSRGLINLVDPWHFGYEIGPRQISPILWEPLVQLPFLR